MKIPDHARPGLKRNTTPLLKVVLSFLMVLTAAAMAAFPAGAQTISDGSQSYLEVEVATIGMDLRTGAPLAILHAEWEEVLPIWIGEVESQAIARARQGIQVPRPQTHDLLASVVEALGGELEEIRVHDLRDATFYGVLRVRVDGAIVEIDSRPSDALALAVRTGARITVATRLVEEHPDVEFISAEGDRSIARVRGITLAEPSGSDRERFGIPEGESGLMVMHSDTPVGPRGVRRGDLVLSVEGREVDGALEFVEIMAGRSADSVLQMRVLRDGEVLDVDVPPRRPPARLS
jgi:uncharacterized protein